MVLEQEPELRLDADAGPPQPGAELDRPVRQHGGRGRGHARPTWRGPSSATTPTASWWARCWAPRSWSCSRRPARASPAPCAHARQGHLPGVRPDGPLRPARAAHHHARLRARHRGRCPRPGRLPRCHAGWPPGRVGDRPRPRVRPRDKTRGTDEWYMPGRDRAAVRNPMAPLAGQVARGAGRLRLRPDAWSPAGERARGPGPACSSSPASRWSPAGSPAPRPGPARSASEPPSGSTRSGRRALAAGAAGLAVLVVTRWPVAALGAAMAAWLVVARRGRLTPAGEIERTEASRRGPRCCETASAPRGASRASSPRPPRPRRC